MIWKYPDMLKSFKRFSKDNQALLDEKRLYVRMTSKSLASCGMEVR